MADKSMPAVVNGQGAESFQAQGRAGRAEALSQRVAREAPARSAAARGRDVDVLRSRQVPGGPQEPVALGQDVEKAGQDRRVLELLRPVLFLADTALLPDPAAFLSGRASAPITLGAVALLALALLALALRAVALGAVALRSAGSSLD